MLRGCVRYMIGSVGRILVCRVLVHVSMARGTLPERSSAVAHLAVLGLASLVSRPVSLNVLGWLLSLKAARVVLVMLADENVQTSSEIGDKTVMRQESRSIGRSVCVARVIQSSTDLQSLRRFDQHSNASAFVHRMPA